MDFLLSLPLLSTLLTPSWSTSLNILFFYATWSTLVLTSTPTSIHLVSLLVLRTLFWLLPSILFLAFDTFIPSLAVSWKFAGKAAMPPDGRTSARIAGLAVGNCVLLTAVEGVCVFAFLWGSGNPVFKTVATLPLPWQMGKHVVGMFAAREVLTYYIHRDILHGGKTSISKLHTSWAHAYPVSSFQLYADHPIPLLINNLIPILLPAALLRPHILTYILFTLLTTIESTFSHSGYSIVPGIFLGGVARRTAVHYASGGKANYGAWGLLDWAHGTSKGGDVLDDAEAEAEKHNVKQRANKKIDSGAGFLQDSVEGLRRSSRRKTPKKAN